jgi:hypothetical protein
MQLPAPTRCQINFQIVADDTHAAFNLQNFGMCRWQLRGFYTAGGARDKGRRQVLGPTEGRFGVYRSAAHWVQRTCRRDRHRRCY